MPIIPYTICIGSSPMFLPSIPIAYTVAAKADVHIAINNKLDRIYFDFSIFKVLSFSNFILNSNTTYSVCQPLIAYYLEKLKVRLTPLLSVNVIVLCE